MYNTTNDNNSSASRFPKNKIHSFFFFCAILLLDTFVDLPSKQKNLHLLLVSEYGFYKSVLKILPVKEENR